MNKVKYIIVLSILIIIHCIGVTSKEPRNDKIKIVDGIKIDKINMNIETVEADTNINNQILQVWYSKTELKVKIKVKDKNKTISIVVYNMLGKEVLRVYDGVHTRDEDDYYINYNLPNGIYICVLQGDNFRDAEKFIISR